MTGVEILSEKIIYCSNLPWYFSLIFIILAVFCVIVAIIMADDYIPVSIICLVLFIAFLSQILYSFTTDYNNIDYITYKVTIDDSVSMNEFLDKYEILDQDGKIYTIKEKE